MMIGRWKCTDNYPGESWASREATLGNVTITADADGLYIEEGSIGYGGGVGRYSIPANVLMWLMPAVR